MSTAFNGEFYSVTTGAASLAALLATDPDTALPCVRYGSKNVAAKDGPFPCITYHESAITPDKRFWQGDHVDTEIYDVEVWTQDTRSDAVSEIYEALEDALQDKGGPDLPAMPNSAGGRVTRLFWCEFIGGNNAAQWDPVLKGYYGCFRLWAKTSRSAT